MLVVIVATDVFSGEFIHKSELPEATLVGIRKERGGLYSEPLHILELALLNPSQRDEFESLKLSDAMKVWNAYRLAVPFERGIPDAMPEGM
jgi:hypothetical protein